MAEYIEREALVAKLNDIAKEYLLDGHTSTILAAGVVVDIKDTVIMEQPTADVVEVRHGEWVEKTEPLGWSDANCIECSACGESWITDEELCVDDYKYGWRYCPHCGAKMDGKGGA